MDTLKAKNIKAGDVVKCSSHSHKMTVREIRGNEVVTNYFINSECHTGIYPIIEINTI